MKFIVLFVGFPEIWGSLLGTGSSHTQTVYTLRLEAWLIAHSAFLFKNISLKKECGFLVKTIHAMVLIAKKFWTGDFRLQREGSLSFQCLLNGVAFYTACPVPGPPG